MRTPEQKAAYHRHYHAMNLEEQRAYNRDYMRTRRRLLRQKAAAFARAWGSLHEISCKYPERGCGCRALLLIAP